MEEIKVAHLRCEYKENPIGIDVLRPRISWVIQTQQRNVMQSAYHIQVSRDKDFVNELIWDSGKVFTEQSTHVEYQGPSLESRVRYFYRVRVWEQNGTFSDWSSISFWEMGILHSEEWKAEWITPEAEAADSEHEPCPLLRKAFEVREGVESARVYVTSLGLYELYINGMRAGDWLFTPGWTSYHKRLQYQTYDITSLLRGGVNVVGAMLGNGWYKGNLAWEGNKNVYGDRKGLLMQMHIHYLDGSDQIVITDSSWQSSTGPLVFSELYHGEVYDARLEKTGWNTWEFDAEEWNGVSRLEADKKNLVAQENVPVRRIQELNPTAILHTPAGETVIDMGQNMVGWVKLCVQGESGSRITLHHAEVLDKWGNFYTENLRSAKQTLQYVLKGEGRETFEPHFTFQGFRFVKVDGYPGELNLDDFCGVVIHSDMDLTGSFECSDELINQLQHNILWGQKGNFLDVPTDCPQRDERLGWTGDAQVFIRTACFNMNTAPFFAKWLRDLKAEQREDGGIPHVIPNVLGREPHSSSAWGDAAVICPWTLYLCYGDERVLKEQYESMCAWVEYIRNQGPSEFLWNTGFHFGDWLALDAREGSYTGATSKDYIATAFFAYSVSLTLKAAKVLGKLEDVEKYSDMYQNIIANFRREYITPNGRLAVPTQTAHVLALMFNLVEEKDKQRVIDTLVELLKENSYHLATGFVGTPYLCHVLSSCGYNDIAFKLVQQKDYPSWLYQVIEGATTIWEHWDGIKEDGSFWSKDMNSFNHYAYGSIGDWLYRVIAGINIDENFPGYKHSIIKPQPVKGLTYAKASLETMYGKLSSSWAEVDGQMEINISIPPNTSSTVFLPSADPDEIARQESFVSYRDVYGGIELELGSGSYYFSYKIADK